MIVPTDTSDAIKAYIREIVSTCHESTPVEEILEKSAQYWQRLAEGEKLSAAVLSKLRMKCLSTSHRKEDLVPFRTVQSICDELQARAVHPWNTACVLQAPHRTAPHRTAPHRTARMHCRSQRTQSRALSTRLPPVRTYAISLLLTTTSSSSWPAL